MKTKKIKQKEADSRKLAHDSRTPLQQLEELNVRIGLHKGAIKERKKLWQAIQQKNHTQA